MGAKDSTKTRVDPVFTELWARDRSGSSWINPLLALPTGGSPSAVGGDWGSLIDRPAWGDSEKPLAPPRLLLELLIRTPALLSQDQVKACPPGKRAELFASKPEIVERALRLLKHPQRREKSWHILEGHTFPDVLLRTDRALIVIEGKRTEPTITEHTKWMPVRHQMLRHLDCAWEMRGTSLLAGLFIVEGDGGAEALEVPPSWQLACQKTLHPEVLARSLPHRSQVERDQIASCYRGVTTWQRVCHDLNIEWASLPDQIAA